MLSSGHFSRQPIRTANPHAGLWAPRRACGCSHHIYVVDCFASWRTTWTARASAPTVCGASLAVISVGDMGSSPEGRRPRPKSRHASHGGTMGTIQRMVATWPGELAASRARALGFSNRRRLRARNREEVYGGEEGLASCRGQSAVAVLGRFALLAGPRRPVASASQAEGYPAAALMV